MPRKLFASLAAALVTAGAAAGAVQFDNGYAMQAQQTPAVVQVADSNNQSDQFATVLSESQAEDAVWAQPDVQQTAVQLRAHGVRPFTMTEATPDPQTQTGNYTIYFGEDEGDHVVRIQTYTVDAHSGHVSVYDPLMVN